VAAGRDIGVAVTGDHNQVILAPPIRSAYLEQVRRIVPRELVGRQDELAELAAFCIAETGPAYAWWRGGAWAGKTALMSWFVLNPPKGVRIVPFFVTARLGAQNDATAYVDVMLEQLAEIAGEGLPAYLTQATPDAHLLRLYGVAARVCAERDDRLVLLVDGLDEDRGVTTGPTAHSIAGLLPAVPAAGMRVLVAGRLNPPIPGDVPDHHPLRAPGVVRLLDQSPYAQAIRTEAERELKQLIEAGGLDYDLLALVTAAGGGLTAEDLAELTGAVPSTRRLDIVDALVASGDLMRAQAFGEALRSGGRGKARELVALRPVRDGDYDRAEARLVSLGEESHATVVEELAEARLRRGEFDHAEKLVQALGDPSRRTGAICRMVSCLGELGEERRATALARSLDERADQSQALVHLAAGLARGGHDLEPLERILLCIEGRTRVPASGTAAAKLSRTAVSLYDAGAVEAAQRLWSTASWISSHRDARQCSPRGRGCCATRPPRWLARAMWTAPWRSSDSTLGRMTSAS
jgi:hypothetical protein